VKTAATLTQLALGPRTRHCSTTTASATSSARVIAWGIGEVIVCTATARPDPTRIARTVRQVALAESATVGSTAMMAPSGA
jgi:hypothetical protein